ncbi:hypothetical protein ACFRKB_35070 [Streptomyces scopuliridis]|uniref:hypothetical protein n=1 Tax=Streptomyces scopuliridis TaxID=452529 RepID=UPI0036C097A9
MAFRLLEDLLLMALAIRVLGRDAIALLRSAAAVGVRVGADELRRTDCEGERPA